MPNTPVEWKKDRKADFRGWFGHELHNTLGDRESLERKWKNNVIQVRARVMGDGTADVPFVGSSDLEMPLTAIHKDPVFADFMQTLHVPKNFWSVTAKKPATVPTAKPLQEFLGVVESEALNMFKVNKRVLLDAIIFGTGIYKDYILHERKKVKDYNEAGEIEDVVKTKFQPAVQHVPLSDFFIPAYATDLDPDDPAGGGAPWVSHRFRLTKGQFLLRADSETPFLPAYDKKAVELVKQWEEDRRDETVKEQQREEDEYQPWRDRKITLYEAWCRFDVDGDGIEEDVVVIWHHPTRTILRATHNPFVHGKRPFEAIRYMPDFGFYGLGLAEMDEWAQLASSKILNATLDNAFLSNAIMLGVPFGANISPDEPIYPGKIFPLGPNEKIQDIQMGRPNPQMYQLMDMFMQWSEQRTGVSELRQGNISNLPGRTPASTILSVLNEGNKRFDMILGNMRRGALKNLGIRVLQNVVQISKTDPRWKQRAIEALGAEDGAKVVQVLDGPVHDVESLFGVSVSATSSQVNKEVDKQSHVQLAQLMAQMYPQLIQYAQAMGQMGNQEMLPTVLQSAFSGTVEVMKRLVESYDIQNPEEYLPPVQSQAEQQQPQQPGMGPQQPAAPQTQAGGPQGAAPFAQGPEQLLQMLGVQ